MCSQQQVYKKDGEGVTYALKQHVFEGEIIEGGPGFPDLSKMITDIRLLHPREDDVLLITYPKSGELAYITNCNYMDNNVVCNIEVIHIFTYIVPKVINYYY